MSSTDRAPLPVPVWATAVLVFGYYCTPLLVRSDRSELLTLVLLPGVISLAALPLRRTRPWLALIITLAGLAFSAAALGAAIAVLASMARHSNRWPALLGAGLAIIAAKAFQITFIYRDWGQPALFEFTLAALAVALAVAVGRWARASADAQDRSMDSARARREAEEHRLNEARLAERERIAREMHDVVAHRISLVAMLSGALAHRTDLDAEARSTLGTIQGNARQALDELRGVLAELRGPDAAPEPPQPSLAELPVLLAECREAGMRVSLADGLDQPPEARISRQAYRILQEGLTNARRHAPGAPVRIELAGRPGGELSIRIVNPLADLAPADRSGSGLGLVGVRERAELLGGRTTVEQRDGRFVLQATIPWEA